MACIFCGIFLVLGQIDDVPAAGHQRNDVLQALLAKGIELDGRAITLPAPTFPDEQSREEQIAALEDLSGSGRALQQFLRDSVSAPFILRLVDEQGGEAIVRRGDLYFAIHAKLEDLNPKKIGVFLEPGRHEVANMAVEATGLTADELTTSGMEPLRDDQHLIHARIRLLDRIVVRNTVELTRSDSPNSVIVAARTAPGIKTDGPWPNIWRTIDRRTGEEGEARPYSGGMSYTKITRLEEWPDTLIVEVHFALAEPMAWFDGAPVLRSKFGLIAQDSIRRFRRSLLRIP